MLEQHPHLMAMPSVFSVGDEYQIFSIFDCAVLVKAEVGGREFYDDSNGVLRSNTLIHRVDLPMELLDSVGEYTLKYRVVIERKPYFPTSEEEREISVSFRPLKGDKLNIYHISDTHNMVAEPVRCGKYFGDSLDLLVLNGDIPNHSGEIRYFNSIYQIAGEITGGSCPCVFSKGNHDTRGIHAEEIGLYTPTDNGRTYYTFRLGSVWGLVLDCGEDKDDSSEEYGGTVCFHNFRLKETDFIKKVINRGEYLEEGIEYRLLICHVPFTAIFKDPFNIEDELFREWARLIGDNIKPHLMICGHKHTTEVCPVGGEMDGRGQPAPLIIGASPIARENGRGFVGGAIELERGKAKVTFNDDLGNLLGTYEIDI